MAQRSNVHCLEYQPTTSMWCTIGGRMWFCALQRLKCEGKRTGRLCGSARRDEIGCERATMPRVRSLACEQIDVRVYVCSTSGWRANGEIFPSVTNSIFYVLECLTDTVWPERAQPPRRRRRQRGVYSSNDLRGFICVYFIHAIVLLVVVFVHCRASSG